MSDINRTHQFQVRIWIPGNDNPQSIMEHGHWMEQARCMTRDMADEVALCLSYRHPQGVQAAELKGTRFVPYKFIPEQARDLK